MIFKLEIQLFEDSDQILDICKKISNIDDSIDDIDIKIENDENKDFSLIFFKLNDKYHYIYNDDNISEERFLSILDNYISSANSDLLSEDQ